MGATATYHIVKIGPVVEAVLDVESTSGWLGCCVITARDVSQIAELAYTEADRRATAAGHRLERLSQKETVFNKV